VKKFLILIPIVSFMALGLFLFVWWNWASASPCKQNCENQIFVVYKGDGVGSVARRLQADGLIRNYLSFRFLTLYLRISDKIQVGDYRLNPQMSLSELTKELTHGTLDVWVTIIEGWRKEQVAIKLSQSGLENFKIDEFLNLTANLEGQLFPDTYLIPKTAGAEKIIDMMKKNFLKKVGLIPERTLILASLIEREMPHAEDRPIVAGILLKRLDAGWPLQVDAAIQYALANTKCAKPFDLAQGKCDWWPKGITKADLEIKSPFNTYLYRGLPPTPICNSGLAAIQAAENPIKTDYWYYLSDGFGITHFAKTIEEHNQNIKKYLQK
jgi:UPF0755 protein